MPTRRQVIKAGITVSSSSLISIAGCTSQGDEFPTTEIRTLIPFGQGGGTDNYTRVIMPEVGRILDENVVFENMTGGAALRPVSEVLEAEDLHTIVSHTVPPFVMSTLTQDPPFDSSQMTSIATIGIGTSAIVAHEQYGVEHDLPGLIELYNDGELSNVGGTSVGGVAWGQAVVMRNDPEFDWQWDEYVPYDGSGPAAVAVEQEELEASFTTPSAAQSVVDDGNVDMVAVTSSHGTPIYPDTPTVEDDGYPNMDYVGQLTRGIWGKPEAEEDHVQILTDAIAEALESDPVVDWSEETGSPVNYLGPDETDEITQEAFERLPEVIDFEELDD